MAVLLFKLRGVPDDEADDVRALLARNDIAFYETPAGRWGISIPAIWLHDESQLAAARSLIEQYQIERAHRVRAEYDQLAREGRSVTLLEKIKQEPLKFILYLLAIAVVIYFSTIPFLDFGK
jgi:hypothetical protein